MSRPVNRELLRLGGLLAAGGGLGALADAIAWGLFAAALVFASWHLRHLARFERWLAERPRGYPQAPAGLWEEIYSHVHRLQQQHKKRKQKLAALLNRFQESTAAMPDATVVLDAHGHIEWFNRSAARLLGLCQPQDRGQRIHNLLRSPEFTAYITGDDYHTPLVMPAPAQPDRTLAVHVVPYGKDQRLLIARDVTRMQRLERIRRDFVTNVSHELRTPLTVIRGYLESLQNDPACRDACGRALATMGQQAQRMQHIVEDLLLLSRLETAHPQDDPHPVAVPGLLRALLEDARLLARDKGHHITLECDEALHLRGNEKELYSAFSNLVFNAVKYTPEGGHIQLRWHQDGEGVKFQVQDDGIGIPPQAIPRLTERFYRVDVGRSRESGGTGLGLAIVKHVLKRHDARLAVKSEVGKGSTFTCIFPTERAVATRAA